MTSSSNGAVVIMTNGDMYSIINKSTLRSFRRVGSSNYKDETGDEVPVKIDELRGHEIRGILTVSCRLRNL